MGKDQIHKNGSILHAPLPIHVSEDNFVGYKTDAKHDNADWSPTVLPDFEDSVIYTDRFLKVVTTFSTGKPYHDQYYVMEVGGEVPRSMTDVANGTIILMSFEEGNELQRVKVSPLSIRGNGGRIMKMVADREGEDYHD